MCGRRGGYTDGFSGRVLNWHRWYDAEQGQWICRDPSDIVFELCQYKYADASPVLFFDATGLASSDSSRDLEDWQFFLQLFSNLCPGSIRNFDKVLLTSYYALNKKAIDDFSGKLRKESTISGAQEWSCNTMGELRNMLNKMKGAFGMGDTAKRIEDCYNKSLNNGTISCKTSPCEKEPAAKPIPTPSRRSF